MRHPEGANVNEDGEFDHSVHWQPQVGCRRWQQQENVSSPHGFDTWYSAKGLARRYAGPSVGTLASSRAGHERKSGAGQAIIGSWGGRRDLQVRLVSVSSRRPDASSRVAPVVSSGSSFGVATATAAGALQSVFVPAGVGL
jgi:hypothetical protein